MKKLTNLFTPLLAGLRLLSENCLFLLEATCNSRVFVVNEVEF